MKVDRQNVYITGGNRGIGLAVGKELNRRGAIIHIVSRSIPKNKDEFIQDFKNPENIEFHQLDLINKDSINEFCENLKSKKIDILFNNAGLLTGGLIEDQPIDDIYDMFQVNLTAPIHLTQKLLPLLIKQGSGKIINNCSVSAVGHLPCASTYAASKAGLMAFTNSVISEVKGTGVSTLTLITPGIKTRMYDEIPKLYGDNMELDFLSSITPEEYAKQICDAIETDQEFFWPKDPSMKIALWIAQHMPGLYRKLVSSKFKRTK